MKHKARMLSDEEEELLRLLKKRGARSEPMCCEEDWDVDIEEDGYDF